MPGTGERGAVYEEDGVVVYRASSLGHCIIELVASRLGETATPPSTGLRQAMDDSSDCEPLVIAEYERQTGHKVIWQQKEVELDLVELGCTEMGDYRYIVRGHLDGLDQEEDCVLEVKSLGPTLWDAFNNQGLVAMKSIGTFYSWQAGIYGHATNRKVKMVIGQKLKDEQGNPYIGDIVIETAFVADVFVPLMDIIDRVQKVEEFAARDELPDCDRNCKPGGWWDHVHIFPEAKDGGRELFESLEQYVELREQIGDKGDPSKDKPRSGLLGNLENLKDYIKDNWGVGKHTAGHFTASISESPGKEYVDTKWLKKNHPDIYELALRRGRPYTQLVVRTSKKGKRDE